MMNNDSFVTEIVKLVCNRVENIVGKRKNAFLPFESKSHDWSHIQHVICK